MRIDEFRRQSGRARFFNQHDEVTADNPGDIVACQFSGLPAFHSVPGALLTNTYRGISLAAPKAIVNALKYINAMRRNPITYGPISERQPRGLDDTAFQGFIS